MSSNNVIYGFQVAYDKKDEKNIDSNTLADQYIKREEKLYQKQLLAEERKKRLKELEESGGEIPEGMDTDEFLGLADSIMGEPAPSESEVQADEIVEEANAKAEEILSEAQAKADEIIHSAQLDAEAMKNLAKQDGYKEGYNEGTQQAAIELKETEDRLNSEKDAEISAMQNDFNEKSLNLEHDIVEKCLPVFKQVFMAELEGKKDVLFHLLDHCLMNLERSKQMLIKVSEENAAFLKTKEEDIKKRVGSDVVVDVISDPLCSDSTCIIETDGGIFDCSIDTELDALIREIKALS